MDTGVEVKLSFFPLAFVLFLCKPRVEIDGMVHPRSWGTHFFPLSPGNHTIKIYFPYVFMSQCGANSTQVNITQGHRTPVRYFMPPWMFAKGSLTVGR